VLVSELERLTFSPRANFTRGAASANFISSAPAPQRNLMTWDWPPIVLAEPWRMLEAVTPPASWR
jgi:hypothetical protein